MEQRTAHNLAKANARGERGVALLASLLFSLTLLGLAASMLTSAVAVDSHGRSLTAVRRAEQAAESGVHHLVARLRADPGAKDELLAQGTVSLVLVGDAGSENAVSYTATVQSGAADGLDNDLDGTIDEADETEAIEIASTGIADNVRRTVHVTVTRGLREFSSYGAVYVGNPGLEISFEDSPNTTISGIDVDLNGNPTGLEVPGLGVRGDPATIVSQIPLSVQDRIVGLGGTRSIHEVDTIQGQIDYLLALARAAPRTTIRQTSVDSPGLVVIRTTELEIEGTVRGAGVLVIESEFAIDEGTIEWNGLVVVIGQPAGEAEVESGRLRVNGGVVFLGTSFEEAEFERAALQIRYSKAMLNLVVPPVPTSFSAVNWRDGPTP